MYISYITLTAIPILLSMHSYISAELILHFLVNIDLLES